MPAQDWSQFFGHDQDRFVKWCSSIRKRLIGQVIHDFHASPEFAEDIAHKSVGFCLSRQHLNLQHLEGALSLTARNFAHEEIRRKRRQGGQQLQLIQSIRQGLHAADELPDERPGPEAIVADHELEPFRLAHFAAVKESLGMSSHEDALKVVEVIEQEGQLLKRAEMIVQTGLSAEAYDRARKQIARASVRKKVLQRTNQILLAHRGTSVQDNRIWKPRPIDNTTGPNAKIEGVEANVNGDIASLVEDIRRDLGLESEPKKLFKE